MMETRVDPTLPPHADGDDRQPAEPAAPAPSAQVNDAKAPSPRRPWLQRLFGRDNAQREASVSSEPFAQVRDPRLRGMLSDNDQRLWYICRYGKSDFDPASLKALVATRQRLVADPDYRLTEAEEVDYLQATMAASEFLGRSEPDAIRLYSLVQNREMENPLRYWLWAIGLFLFLALGVNGYQSLIGAQMQKMHAASEAYFELVEGLSISAPNLNQQLMALCKHSHEFKLAAGQLNYLLHPLTSEDSEAEPPRVCTMIRSWLTTRAIQPRVGPTLGPTADDAATAQIGPAPTTVSAVPAPAQGDAPIIAVVRGERFAEARERELLPQAQAVQSILSTVLLPMFYASLGALTSALRAANAELKAMTLTRIDNVSLFARVLLGVVGGATIGIVFKTDVPGTSGLTTLGLAFAVGYAVDLFFNVLDGLKSALGDGGRPSQGKR